MVSADLRSLPDGCARSHAATSRPCVTSIDTLDTALLERIVRGDKLSMKVFYVRHNVRVYRLILRFTGNEAVAEELVNEVFLEVWRKAIKFKNRSQVSTWLLAIARHKAIEVMRRRSTEPLGEGTAALIEDTSDNPEMATQRVETSSIIHDCLTQLSPAHREIVDLVYYHEKSVGEVAKIIGIPRNTAKTRMFYARRRLADLLGVKGIHAA
jgi:RNA polymerase sigma-70 factor, ECF subfamily